MKRARTVLTGAEVRLLLASCNQGRTGRRNRALIVLLYRTGLRISEALDLELGDLDLGRKTLAVRNGKGGRARVVPIDSFVRDELAAWDEVRPRSPHLFCTLTGARVLPSYVRELLPRLAGLAGIKKRVHPHAFRHSLAFEMANERTPLHVIMRVLGHANLSTTTTYLDHLGNPEMIEAIERRAWNG